jgi:hypothetical protein
MKQVIITGMIGLAAASLWAADAKDEVTKAAKQLADKANYTWVQTAKSEGGGQFGGGSTEGKINKEGLAYIVMKLGEDRTFESAMKGEKLARKGQDGWQAVEQGQGGGGGRGGFGRNFANPAAQAENLVKQMKDLKSAGEGVYAGDMTEEGAKPLLSFGGRGGQNAPAVSGAKGSAKFWIKNGTLSKFEYNVQGKVTRNDQEREVNRTTTVEIKDVGTTKVELPAEAKDALK